MLNIKNIHNSSLHTTFYFLVSFLSLLYLQQQHTDPITQTIVSEEVQELCNQLDTKLSTLVQKIDILKQNS